jgi:pSer/pThr/pTyr-binding forkhead associated (FHA) protein
MASAPPPPAGGAHPHESPRPAIEPSSSAPTRDHDDGRTRILGGIDLARVKIPRYRYSIQVLDSGGQWRDWGPIHANGVNIGRSRNSADFPALGTMAVKHMRLSYDHNVLMVEDLGSLNGLYLRMTQPAELADGMRFRVGSQVIEFHRAEPFDPETPQRSQDEEEFFSRDLEPLAYLDLIRPSGRPGLRFPITKRDCTIIGREGPGVNISLTDDPWVSAPHAQVRIDEGRFLLEDLRSRNGTFVHISGSRNVNPGDVILAGRVLFRVADHSSGS